MTFPRRESLVIADASPLIFLSKLGHLELLSQLSEHVVVPSAVWEELTSGEVERPEVNEIRRRFEGCIVTPEPALFASYRLQLDAGEAAALAIAAKAERALLLMDDARGRALAQVSGFRVMGTIGLLIRAKRASLIPEIRHELKALKRAGMFLDESLVRTALEAVGETEPG